jgi:hypothetical protein
MEYEICENKVSFSQITTMIYKFYLQTIDSILNALERLNDLIDKIDSDKKKYVHNFFSRVEGILNGFMKKNENFHYEINKKITRLLDYFLKLTKNELNKIEYMSNNEVEAFQFSFESVQVIFFVNF